MFYLEDSDGLQERLELQFLCEDPITIAAAVTVQISEEVSFPMLAYKSSIGKLVLGNLEPNCKLQNRRIGFRKQVNRVVAVAEPGSSGNMHETELLVASIEEPNFAYLDASKDNVNTVALISKTTFRTIDVFKLDKNEVVNCLLHVQKQVSGTESKGAYGGSNRFVAHSYIVVGTAYLQAEETMPTKGRVLIFKVQPQLYRLQLVHQTEKNGSIQQVATLGENHKYLVLAVNNRLDLLQFNLRLGENFDLSLLDSKAAGSLLNVVKTVDN